MKAEVQLPELIRVANAAKSMLKRPTIPILACLIVEAKGDAVTVARFDYEYCVEVNLSGGMSDGRIAVDATAFADALKALTPKGKAAKTARVQLVADERTLQISVNDGPTVTLELGLVEDYPGLPVRGDRKVTALHAFDFAEIIRTVLPASSRGGTIPMLNHVQIARDNAGDPAYAQATDRYRAHRLTIGAAGLEPFRLLVHRDVFKLTAALTKGMTTIIELSDNGADDWEGQFYTFAADNGSTTVTWRAMDPDFPKLLSLFLVDAPHVGHVNATDLHDAVKSAAALMEKGSPVVLSVEGESLYVTARAEVNGQLVPVWQTNVPTADVFHIPDGQYGFDPNYLCDLLKAVPSGVVATWKVTTPMKPILLQNGAWMGLIMPMRLGG